MKLKQIHRTSTFAWSPYASIPLLATGTVAGALDESFSNESQLEIWAPNFLDKNEFDLGIEGITAPKGVIKDTARFNRLAWGSADAHRPQGVIAAGLENGELALCDPAKILAGESAADSLILRNTTHTGPVRGLDFNPTQTSLLASGAIGGEVYIWDLKDPSKPYSPTPGTKSTKLDEITSVAWNQQVSYVLAGASSTGFTVVWDLRGKREVVALQYGGGAGTLAGQATSAGMAAGGRRGMSDIAWHPDNATRLVTASEDDSSPVIMVWDLRNARAPEKILTGHEKGILSLSWCKQDADLLLSCGKDNRVLCWNPQTSEIIAELPSADNWAFQVEWCPRNPDMLATAFFDGTIGIHSIQSTNETAAAETKSAQPVDAFDPANFSQAQHGTLSLKQTPKWLRRPISSTFGFGGKLVSVSNLASAQGKNQSSVIHVRKVVTENDFVERATKLQEAIDDEGLQAFAQDKVETAAAGGESWKALLSLFKANSRNELVTLLGFSKEEIAARVAEAVDNLKNSAKSPLPVEEDASLYDKPHESVVSFAEPEKEEEAEEDQAAPSEEATPSEVSTGVTSDTASAVPQGDAESATTAPSLFGDEVGTPQHDFFDNVSSVQDEIPHTNYGLDSSVAATMGSGPSSVTSETARGANSFKIYTSEESEIDRLVTKALVLGDFESAVSLCLSSDRFADAILLAVRGGPELLQRTQKAYFDRQTTSLPYLRLFQSIVTNDLTDIVQNADLQEWREIFVVLCTFASQEEFAGLVEQLGGRLEEQFRAAKAVEDPDAELYRKNATLTYLAASRLERLVDIWSDELYEEEKTIIADEQNQDSTYYSARANALQSFIEKVSVFRAATGYKDQALEQDTQEYKLSALYDKYFEYADLLSTQGLLKEAVTILKLTPSGYQGSSPSMDLESERKRLMLATSEGPVASTSTAVPKAPAAAPAAPRTYGSGYPGYGQPQQPIVSQSNPYGYNAGAQNNGPGNYAPAQPATHPAYQPAQPSYHPQPNYSQPAHGHVQPQYGQPPLQRPQQPPVAVPLPPPPRAGNGAPPVAAVASGKRQPVKGWNDAPEAIPVRASPSITANKPSAITAPFPNAVPSPQPSPYPAQGGSAPLPPPPRPGSVNRGPVPPPPPGPAQGFRGPPSAGANAPPHSRPPSQPISHPPPNRILSPQQGPPARLPTPSQYAPPPAPQGQAPPPPGPYGRPPGAPGIPQQMAQQGSFARATPPPPGPYGPPQHQQAPPPPTGPYGAPQHQQAPPSGPYAPPPQSMQPQQHHIQQQPPHPGLAQHPPPPMQQGGPPPPSGPPGGPPRAAGGAPRVSTPARAQPAAPKYPAGDRSHIPAYAQPAYQVISQLLDRFKQIAPANQRRQVESIEQRINPLFDALNCETLSRPVVDQLVVLTQAMANHDRPAALALHVDLLTRGSQTDDIGLWMSGVKQLILTL
ncbi:hypothetical protein BJ165DRAFT_1418148 [Panaeolus papilionaceus]|nr:hypothetical protein BJ165DRAFT_1418148 [Panaeolus papilionaceus]